MDFTQYSQLLSYIPSPSTSVILDVIGQTMPSSADAIINLSDDAIQSAPLDAQYDAIFCRFALCLQLDPYTYLTDMMRQLKPHGMLIVQDYVLPDVQKIADYLNGFIYILNKKHVKSFAQYAWNGLLLDVGLNIQSFHHRPIKMTLQQWIEYYQPSNLNLQQAQVMLVQAPNAVDNTLHLQYAGTSYAEFELQEIVCVAQKES